MKLAGTLTTLGQLLSAKLLMGTSLSITKIMAGSGQTPKTATALAAPQQVLAVSAPECSGTTVTIPVTLAADLAQSAYTLKELGVYAQDPDAGEILYQVYRLDEPVSVTLGSGLVLRFYLSQTLSEDLSVTVPIPPAGLLIESDLQPLRTKASGVMAAGVTQDVSAENLQAAINALPRNLTQDVTFRVGGAATEKITVQNFYGNGSLTITGYSTAAHFTAAGIEILNCQCLVRVSCVDFPAASTFHPRLLAQSSGYVRLEYAQVVGDDACTGVSAVHASIMVFESSITHCETAVSTNGLSYMVVFNYDAALPFLDNIHGAYTYAGGMVQLGGTVPPLLGGVIHGHGGGLIVKVDGTLL